MKRIAILLTLGAGLAACTSQEPTAREDDAAGQETTTEVADASVFTLHVSGMT